MKKVKILLATLALVSIISCSSQKTTTTTKEKTVTETTRFTKPTRASDRDTTGFSSRPHPGRVNMQHSYKCCFGDYTSDQPISCPNHNIDLVTVGSYYCTKCDGVVSTHPGDCPVHKTALKQMQ